jgi:hypothetical protein
VGGGGEIFRTCRDRPWGPPSLLYDGYRVFPGGKEWLGRDAVPSPPSSAVGHERIKLHLYSPYGPYGLYRASGPVQGCTLPLLYLNIKIAWDVTPCSVTGTNVPNDTAALSSSNKTDSCSDGKCSKQGTVYPNGRGGRSLRDIGAVSQKIRRHGNAHRRGTLKSNMSKAY